MAFVATTVLYGLNGTAAVMAQSLYADSGDGFDRGQVTARTGDTVRFFTDMPGLVPEEHFWIITSTDGCRDAISLVEESATKDGVLLFFRLNGRGTYHLATYRSCFRSDFTNGLSNRVAVKVEDRCPDIDNE